MPEIVHRNHLPFTRHQLFTQLCDVELYPDYLPGWKSVRKRKVQEGGFEADVALGFENFRERYTCQIILKKDEAVLVRQIKGPFRRLDTDWILEEAQEGGTLVTCRFTYEFRNKLALLLAEKIIQRMQRRVMEAFEKRAYFLYGGAEIKSRNQDG